MSLPITILMALLKVELKDMGEDEDLSYEYVEDDEDVEDLEDFEYHFPL